MHKIAWAVLKTEHAAFHRMIYTFYANLNAEPRRVYNLLQTNGNEMHKCLV